MSITPVQARMALAGFLLIGTATAGNILYFQDPALVSSTAKQKAERVLQRAEADRRRRLALEPQEKAPPAAKAAAVVIREPVPVAPAPAATAATVQPGRAGRFSPTAGQLDQAATTLAEPEPRMPEIVMGIQQVLGQKGYDPGTPDGVVGVVTRAAIMAYEHDSGLPLTAEPTEQILAHMRGQAASRPHTHRNPRGKLGPNAEQITRTVQHTLAQLGYFTGKIDGHSGDETVRAIREYEMDVGLTPSGRVSAPLLLKLARSSSSKTAGR